MSFKILHRDHGLKLASPLEMSKMFCESYYIVTFLKFHPQMSWKSLHFFHPFQSWNSISTLGSILKYTFIELLQLGHTGFFVLITKWYIHDNGKDTLQRDFSQKRPRQLRRLCHASILFYSSNFMAVLRLSKSARFRFLLTSLPDSFFLPCLTRSNLRCWLRKFWRNDPPQPPSIFLLR